MTNIVITAGGTVEAIDGVRQISNISTGGLCACIYKALAEFISGNFDSTDKADCKEREFKVHYVVSSTAVRPEASVHLPVTFYPVTDVKSTEAVLRALMTDHKIHFVIHGMAVSDFTKGYLSEREELAGELTLAIEKALEAGHGKCSHDDLKSIVSKILQKPVKTLDTVVKASSQTELILSLVKTPKLIGKIKQWDPETYLVGFKLLKAVSEEELIRVAVDLSEKNSCDLVLANDVTNIGNDRHLGILIKDRQVVGRYQTKKDIAKGIVEHMLAGKPLLR